MDIGPVVNAVLVESHGHEEPIIGSVALGVERCCIKALKSGPGTVRALPDIGVDVLEGRTGGAAAGKNDGRKEKEDKAYVVHKGLLVKKETSQGLFLQSDLPLNYSAAGASAAGASAAGAASAAFLRLRRVVFLASFGAARAASLKSTNSMRAISAASP